MSHVSRSVYQKLAEENKRLKNDIRILIEGEIPEIIDVREKYEKQYGIERSFRERMKSYGLIWNHNPRKLKQP